MQTSDEILFNDPEKMNKSGNDTDLRVSDIIIDNAPIGIFIINSSFTIIRANDAFVRLSDFSKERLLHMKISDFVIVSREGKSLEEAITFV